MTASALPEPLEAFPIPDGAIVLDEQLIAGLSEREIALAALRQAMAQWQLALPLGPERDLADPDRLLILNRFAVQLVCGGLLSDGLAVPLAPWRSPATAPQLLLAALVDSENGVVHWPGVLTGPEGQGALQAAPWQGQGEGQSAVLPLEAFQGGIERLFTVVQLVEPAALPRLALPSLARTVVQVRDWLNGQLDDLLAGLGGSLQPAALAAGFRGAAAGARQSDQPLALLAIPLGINPEQQLVSGDAAGSCMERFRLLLIPSGNEGPQELLLRLVPELEGDLLPAGLALQASQGGSSQSLTVSISSQLDLRFPASDALIAVSLTYPGSAPLLLPPLQLSRP